MGQRASRTTRPRPSARGPRVNEQEIAMLERIKGTPGAIALLSIFVNLPASHRSGLLKKAKEIEKSSGTNKHPGFFEGLDIFPAPEGPDEQTHRNEWARPSEIRMWGESAGRFGKSEVEQSAGRLVMFFREHGDQWISFTRDELAGFYREKGWDPAKILVGLMGVWYDDGGFGMWRPSDDLIAMDGTGRCRVTERFVARCVDV